MHLILTEVFLKYSSLHQYAFTMHSKPYRVHITYVFHFITNTGSVHDENAVHRAYFHSRAHTFLTLIGGSGRMHTRARCMLLKKNP